MPRTDAPFLISSSFAPIRRHFPPGRSQLELGPLKRGFGFLAVYGDDVLSASALLRSVAEQAQPLQHVEQHRIANRKHAASLIEPVVLGDDLPLALRQIRMGTDDDIEMIVPKPVLVTGRAGLVLAAHLKNSRQQEVLELELEVAIGTDVPAKAV